MSWLAWSCVLWCSYWVCHPVCQYKKVPSFYYPWFPPAMYTTLLSGQIRPCRVCAHCVSFTLTTRPLSVLVNSRVWRPWLWSAHSRLLQRLRHSAKGKSLHKTHLLSLLPYLWWFSYTSPFVCTTAFIDLCRHGSQGLYVSKSWGNLVILAIKSEQSNYQTRK